MNSEIAAFAAGLFDGEGCVGIQRQQRAYKNGTYVNYALRVEFHMINKAVLEFMRQQFGGIQVHKCKRYARRRQGYRWDLYSSAAAEFLRTIKPYSIVKRREIATALSFHAQNVRYQKHNGFRKRTANEIAARERYCARLRLLKKGAS